MSDTSRTQHWALWAFAAWVAVTTMWWALAFAPLPLPAATVAQIRAICFGTLANGLPDTWGWSQLFLAPASLLAFLVAGWGRELAAGLRALGQRRAGQAALALLLIGTLAGTAAVTQRVVAAERAAAAFAVDARSEPLPPDYPRRNAPAVELNLVDQRGEALTLADLRGQEVLLTFAFAHCTTVCPVIVETVRRAAEAFPGAPPTIAIVTLDPWRDTPSTLPSLAGHWKLDAGPAAAHVLSGEVDEVLAVLDGYGVAYQRDHQTGDVAHPPLVHLLDAEGRIAYSFTNPPPAWLAQAVERLRSEPQS